MQLFHPMNKRKNMDMGMMLDEFGNNIEGILFKMYSTQILENQVLLVYKDCVLR